MADRFRASFGVFTDDYNIHNVPGLADRSGPSFGGLSSGFDGNFWNARQAQSV